MILLKFFQFKNLLLLSNNKENKKLEIIKIDFDKLNLSSESNDFIEVFLN